MNFDKMEAGHEIDAKVAADIMGWVRVSSDDTREDGATVFMVYDGRKVLRGTPYEFDPGLWSASFAGWSPSTDIMAAWEVVEKLNLLEKYALHRVYGAYTVAYAWHVSEIDSRGVLQGFVAAETAPLAICRAALKAVENAA